MTESMWAERSVNDKNTQAVRPCFVTSMALALPGEPHDRDPLPGENVRCFIGMEMVKSGDDGRGDFGTEPNHTTQLA